MKALSRDLKKKGLKVRLEEPLWRYTTVRVGGPADLMAYPETLEEVLELWEFSRRQGLRIFWLSGGSKVLFADAGFRGVVVNLRGLKGVVELSSGHLGVMCGTPVAVLTAYGLKRGFSGTEFLAGVPATVGGAIMMNAGAFGEEFGDLVESVTMLTPEGLREYSGKDLFGYRTFRGPSGVVLSARLRLRPRDPEEVRARVRDFLARRRATQPLGRPSFGCAFKNPPEGPAAGELLEAAGLKGFRRGEAMISSKHANFILNLGRARAEDIRALMEEARERVQARFGVELEPEVRIVAET
ncbi:UDP-N-acetylmuramate dehydrogenase [Thermosulfurimonas marina]|uniref:UDP-N-acetylenolpyruvoylglucosamine reductase n=1 Tax=Thermosulfurimonas marina TaxID=2047767 RepID=A0A6H1WRI9_9BACT|nr:UDP-N-acetylmuramate dehydrogenase [Thermosulfurimonas marina]QJA05756.1 UDP-N-acetylmuramate dehydrogenase [Thermosulfurimonas marina]